MEELVTDMKNLTEYEHLGLNHRYNMADGHAHQQQSSNQQQILNRLTELWAEAQQALQADLEREFKTAFFGLAGQSYTSDADFALLSYSASVSIEVIANFLKRRGLSVSLLNPTFDNIPCILKRVGVTVKVLEETALRQGPLETFLDQLDGDAIFLVCPNNPTGHVLNRTEFETIVQHCKRARKMLIVDFSFRFFSNFVQWDQYQMMQDAGIDFITIEDTGKTWPTLDLKVGMTACNEPLYRELFDIHNDILLNVSPLILKVLIEYIRDSQVNGLNATIGSVIQENRQVLAQALAGTILTPVTDSETSIEWLYINHPQLTSTQLWEYLSSCDVYVLPGTHFHWHRPVEGDKHIRIALMRPVDTFRNSAQRLRNILLAGEFLPASTDLGLTPRVPGLAEIDLEAVSIVE